MSGKVKNIMKLRRFSLICLFVSIPMNFISALLSITFLNVLGLALFIIFIVITFYFWRCPHCRRRLPIKFNINEDIDDNYSCPYCNEKF
ncbi:hypothetical protein HMPREF1982_01315 [Clostridiales bacterium oral taxon 876 str. F0540]|nr:hypothetical protein HMPREF1982_01315 [Clostridiales bacterium oral taxon 876 str. F0540]